MEHLIVTPYKEGYVKLIAETGYRLVNTNTGIEYSEAVVKKSDTNNWKVILIKSVKNKTKKGN